MSDIQQPLHLLDLPVEILEQILEFLPLSYIRTVRLTCSLLYQISQSKAILRKQKFIFQFIDLDEETDMLNRIIEMNLSYLNIDINLRSKCEINYIESVISKILLFLGPKIISLNLMTDYKYLSFSTIEDIMFSCVNLKKLYLRSVELKRGESEISRIKPNDFNTKLEILEIINCRVYSYHDIPMILHFYPAIKTLKLTPTLTEVVDGYKVQLIDAHIVDKITTHNKSIQNLELNIVDVYHGNTTTLFKKLASSDLKLRGICIGNDYNISSPKSRLFKTLLSKYNNLKQLEIKNCHNFEAEYLQYLNTNSPKLEHLILRNFQNPIKFPDDLLTKTQIGLSLKILEFDSVKLFGGTSTGLNFPHLESFKLNNCSIEDEVNCFKFLGNCNLKHLDVAFCLLESTTILSIISACQVNLKYLIKLHKELELIDMLFMKDTLITLLLHCSKKIECHETISNVHFSKLEKLNIYASVSLTSAIINNFNIPCLRYLVFYSYPIKEQECKMMMTECRFLEVLSLLTEGMLDDQTLLDLSKDLYFLRSFNRFGFKGKNFFCKRLSL